MASGNFISLYGAVKVNGLYVIPDPDQFLQDVDPGYICWVMPVNIPDQDGTTVAAFWIRLESPQQETAWDVFLFATATLASLANFQTGLTTVSATNKFTIYTNLIKTSDMPASLTPANTGVMTNDTKSWRIYLVEGDETKVTVNCKNRLLGTDFYFEGDQTFAGQYEYFGSGGNS